MPMWLPMARMGVDELAVVMVFLIPLSAIVGGVVLAALRILRGDSRRRIGPDSEEETRMIQEIYNGLSGLERRIEALETLLLDRERKDGSS